MPELSPNRSFQTVPIRRAGVDDAHAIAEVHVHSWQWGYRGLIPDGYLDVLSVDRRANAHMSRLASEGEGRTWVAELERSIVGFASSGPSRDPDAASGTAEIGAIYLRQEVAGTGVGQALLAHAMNDLRQRGYTRATLWVLETNARARRFYEKQGWAPDGGAKIEDWAPGVRFHQVRYRRSLAS